MVAKVDEQQVAVVALAMDPAGKSGGLPLVGQPEFATGVGPVGMHGLNTSAETRGARTGRAGRKTTWKGAFCQAPREPGGVPGASPLPPPRQGVYSRNAAFTGP